MEQTYILIAVRPFSRNLRSELFKTPKIFFYDTGIMLLLWLKRLPREPAGSAFETSIFSELTKKRGPSAAAFWRTKDHTEIDFIVNDRGTIFPLEAKINFAKFKPAAVNKFAEKYKVHDYKVVGLEGKPQGPHFCWPWEI